MVDAKTECSKFALTTWLMNNNDPLPYLELHSKQYGGH